MFKERYVGVDGVCSERSGAVDDVFKERTVGVDGVVKKSM